MAKFKNSNLELRANEKILIGGQDALYLDNGNVSLGGGGLYNIFISKDGATLNDLVVASTNDIHLSAGSIAYINTNKLNRGQFEDVNQYIGDFDGLTTYLRVNTQSGTEGIFYAQIVDTNNYIYFSNNTEEGGGYFKVIATDGNGINGQIRINDAIGTGGYTVESIQLIHNDTVMLQARQPDGGVTVPKLILNNGATTANMFVGKEANNLNDLVISSTNDIHVSGNGMLMSTTSQGGVKIGADATNYIEIKDYEGAGLINCRRVGGNLQLGGVKADATGVGFISMFPDGPVQVWDPATYPDSSHYALITRKRGIKLGNSSTGPELFEGYDGAVDNDLILATTNDIWLSAGGDVYADADILPAVSGAYDLGKTDNKWKNLWANLVNGADIGLDNGWRLLEAEKYEGYPVGLAVGYEGFTPGEVTKVMGDNKPLFVVTDDFIEYKGVRVTAEQLEKLLALV